MFAGVHAADAHQQCDLCHAAEAGTRPVQRDDDQAREWRDSVDCDSNQD